MTRARDLATQTGLTLLTTSTQAPGTTNSLDGVFNANYKNYKIIGNFTSSGGGGAPVAAYFKFKVGAAYSGAHYGSNVYGSYNDTVARSINSFNTAALHFGYTNQGPPTHFEMDIHNPFIDNVYKSITGQYNCVGIGVQGSFGGHPGTVSSYTGFELTLSTGNISGFYQVYGYNDGV